MPKYCISEFTGAGTGDDPYRPLGVGDTPGWVAIDFRPDSTKLDGFCIVAYPDDTTLPKTVMQIADYKTSKLNLSTKTLFSNKIGLNIETENFDEILLELLTTHATPPNDTSRWNPIMYTVDKRFEIWLGEKVVDIPFVGGGATYTESFNKADSTTLGPDLTWTTLTGNSGVVNNGYGVVTTGTLATDRADSDTSTNNNYAQIVYTSTTTSATSLLGVGCRCNSSTPRTLYWGSQGDEATQNNTQLYKVVTGTTTALSTSTHTKATNDIIKVTANGSTVELLFNSVANMSVTDTAITTGVRGAALIRFASAANPLGDSFEVGDLSISATTTPSTIARSFAINAPALNSLHGATVITQSVSINSPTITSDYQIAPTSITNAVSMPAPTVVGGSGVYPDTIPLAVAFPSPTVTGTSISFDENTINEVSSHRRRGSTIGKYKTK